MRFKDVKRGDILYSVQENLYIRQSEITNIFDWYYSRKRAEKKGLIIYYQNPIKLSSDSFLFVEQEQLPLCMLNTLTVSKKEVKCMLEQACVQRIKKLTEDYNANVDNLYKSKSLCYDKIKELTDLFYESLTCETQLQKVRKEHAEWFLKR